MKASEIDRKFDENKDEILEYFDTSKIKMINEESKRVNIDFPTWMIQSLDKEAKHSWSKSSSCYKNVVGRKASKLKLSSCLTFQQTKHHKQTKRNCSAQKCIGELCFYML